MRFEELQLGELLGRGTVGEIFAASAPNVDETVAVKLLRADISDDPLIRSRFRREMQILQRMQHDHIVSYLGGGEHEGRLFYVMEQLPGGNVQQLLTCYQTLHPTEAASIVRQLSSALQHLHNQGIVHRDVKPSNLFLAADGTVKLGDFGIARDKNQNALAAANITVGTHAYMAPEQIMGHDVGPAADLYSAGCVLFELLAGRPPMVAETLAQVLHQHLHRPAPRLTEFAANCPQPLVDLVAKMLEKSPQKRPFNARAVQATLMQFLSGSEIQFFDTRDPGQQRLRKKIQPQPTHSVSWPATVGLAAAVLATIALASKFLG